MKIITIESGKATCMEDVNYGLDRCGNGGVLVVSSIDKQYISIAYYDPYDKVTIIATGILKNY